MIKPHYPHPIIAREGWPVLAMAAVVPCVVSFWSFWAALPFWVLALFVLQFFRDPARQAPDAANAVLSAADGRIVALEHARDPYAARDALRISVLVGAFNMHASRAPLDGMVVKAQYFSGEGQDVARDQASGRNERSAIVIQSANGQIVTAVQVAGGLAKRIFCYVTSGSNLARGQRYGFIRFRSRVDIYLPLDARPRVALGDKVRATSTVLADLAD